MTTEMIDGFQIAMVIIVAWIILSPILCWVLPNRSHPVESVVSPKH